VRGDYYSDVKGSVTIIDDCHDLPDYFRPGGGNCPEKHGLNPTHHKPQSPSKNEQTTGIGQWIFLEELFTAVDSAVYGSIVCKESENNNIHK